MEKLDDLKETKIYQERVKTCKQEQERLIRSNLWRIELQKENEKLKEITRTYKSMIDNSDNDDVLIIASKTYWTRNFFDSFYISSIAIEDKIRELEELGGTYDAKIILQQLLREYDEER